MPEKTYNVLFICTGNSTRSILAEGLLNGLSKGRFRAYSAGSQPKGEVNPLALAALERMHLPTTGYRSKSWDEFVGSDAPQMDFIFTVCDEAAEQSCPVWSGRPVSAHWGVPDPTKIEAHREAELHLAYQEAATVLRRRIELFMSLPLDRLGALSLQRELHGIGNQ